jgi:hypothetical protein
MEGQLNVLLIQKASTEPKKTPNAKRTSQILDSAKKNGIKLDPEVITDAGKKYIKAASTSGADSYVWNAALEFLNYRSFLNAGLAPTKDLVPFDNHPLPWQFKFNYKAISPGSTLVTGSKVPAERAAVIEPLNEHLNQNEKVGFEYLLISDFRGGFELDGTRFKNIIFKDSKIIYKGGHTVLENVFFVDCTFDVSRKENGHNFANSVLATNPATNFHVQGS